MDLIVIETNGDLEGVDSLKAAFDGATFLGLNILEHSFDKASQHVDVKMRHLGKEALSTPCRECSIIEICGGGYLPNRFSKNNKFSNPSIFCHDLMRIIYHIKDKCSADIDILKDATVN